MFFLSATGIVITDYFPQYSNRYWIAMVIAFAVACVILEWSHARNDGTKWTTIVGILLLLWVGLIHAIYIVFILQHTGELSPENADSIILLLLALITYFFRDLSRLAVNGCGDIFRLSVIGAAYLERFPIFSSLLPSSFQSGFS